jgi:hypothetical protein
MERWMQQLKETYIRMLEDKAVDTVNTPKPAPVGNGKFGGGKPYIKTSNYPASVNDGRFGGGKPYVKTSDYDADGNLIPGTTRDAKPEVDPHIKPLPKPRFKPTISNTNEEIPDIFLQPHLLRQGG